MSMARILFHRVVQQDHPEIAQQVSGHQNSQFSFSLSHNHNQTGYLVLLLLAPNATWMCHRWSLPQHNLNAVFMQQAQRMSPRVHQWESHALITNCSFFLSLSQIAASLEKNLIPRLSSSPPDIEALRLYLILPECPLFNDRNNFVTIAIPFAKSVISLKEAPLKVLGEVYLQPLYFSKNVASARLMQCSLLYRPQETGGLQSSPRPFSGSWSCTKTWWCICFRCTRWESLLSSREFSTASWIRASDSWRSCTRWEDDKSVILLMLHV